MAHPGLQGPGVDGPARLQVGIEAGGGVHLVAAQLALHAELVAVEVLVAATVVAALVVVEADGQVQLARRLAYRLQPAHGAAVEVAVEVHHAAATLTVGDHPLGDRQVLHDTALAHVGVDLQGRLAEVALVVHPGLLVVDALARVVQLGVGGDGARVVLVGVPGLPQRIFSVVLFQAAVDQRQAAVGVGPEVELGEGLVAARGAVVAVAVGVHPRSIHQETDPVALAFRVQVVAAQAIAADGGFRADPRGALAVAGEHLDHPAGVAAVDRRGRPAQYLDALGDVEVEGRGLALAIRRAGRDAVGEQLQPADTEGRAAP